MRRFSTFVCSLAIVALTSSMLLATPVILVNGVDGGIDAAASTGGNDLFVFGISNAGSDEYDTIDVKIIADPGKEFLNPSNNALFAPEGGDNSAFLGLNTVATGLALVGIEGAPERLSGVITTFGGAPTDGLNNSFAQVVGAPGLSGTYVISFARAGSPVLEPVQGVFGIPEPTSVALASLGLIGMFAGRRRS